MANTTTARVDRPPTYNDVEIAGLVHRAMADVQDACRFGDRKVFIASLWTRMITIEAQTGGTLTEGATIEHFKAWLLRSRLLTCDGTEHGARLIVLCRADLVAPTAGAPLAASAPGRPRPPTAGAPPTASAPLAGTARPAATADRGARPPTASAPLAGTARPTGTARPAASAPLAAGAPTVSAPGRSRAPRWPRARRP